VVSGLLNKQAAAELGISEVTLQIHRSKIMQKMQAASLADLVRIAEKLQIPITHSRRPGSRENAQLEVMVAIVDDDQACSNRSRSCLSPRATKCGRSRRLRRCSTAMPCRRSIA
jgi:hypothetical protein